MIVLLTGSHELKSTRRGVQRLTVHQVVNFGAGHGRQFWAVYSTAEARKHRRYKEALAILMPSTVAALPPGVIQVSAPRDPGSPEPVDVEQTASTNTETQHPVREAHA